MKYLFFSFLSFPFRFVCVGREELVVVVDVVEGPANNANGTCEKLGQP